MRGGTQDLAVPHSLLDGMPSVYRTDRFVVGLLDGLDMVLAPVHSVLDNIDAYCDPSLSPEDFLPWLASWVGVAVDERQPVRRRRELIRAAPELYRWRGTVRGVASAVALYTGTEPEVVENGGCRYDGVPGAPFPGTPGPSLLVRVRTERHDLDDRAIDAVVAQAKPVHVPHHVELVVSGR